MSALADYGLIWRHAVKESAVHKAVWAICAVSAVGGAILAYRGRGQDLVPTPLLLIILPLLMLGMLYWLALVSGVVKQLTPANAQLAPRLRSRAIQLVGAYYLVFTIAITVTLGGAFGHQALWAAVGASWLVGVAMTRIGLQHGMVLQLIPFLMMMTPKSILQFVLAASAGPVRAAVCGAVVVLAAWYGLRQLFPRGDRHFRQRVAVERGVPTDLGQGVQGTANSRGLYAFDLERAGSKQTPPGELMLHAFGPAAHWSGSVKMLGVLALVLVAGRFLLELTAEDKQQAVSYVGGFVIFPLLMLFASGPQKIVGRAFATAGEQALLRMTPAMPRMHDFNRELADALLRRALVEWILVTTGLVLVTVMIDAPWDISLLQFAVCCLALPITTVVLRDYARSPKLSQCYMPLATLGLVIAAGMTYFASLRISPVFASAIAITVGVCVAVMLARVRKLRMVQAPPAFPAGRMAP